MNAWPWLERNTLHIWAARLNFSIAIKNGKLNVMTELSQTTDLGIAHKISELTAMKVEVQSGLTPDFMQITGQAQIPLKSICVNQILESELPYIAESVQKYIVVSNALIQ